MNQKYRAPARVGPEADRPTPTRYAAAREAARTFAAMLRPELGPAELDENAADVAAELERRRRAA